MLKLCCTWTAAVAVLYMEPCHCCVFCIWLSLLLALCVIGGDIDGVGGSGGVGLVFGDDGWDVGTA